MAAKARIRRFRDRSLPHVPIEVGGNRLLQGKIVFDRIVRDSHFDADDLSDAPFADAFYGVDEVFFGALLRAGAENALVLLGGVENRAALANRKRHRLLEEDVLPRAAGLDRHLRVPEVRRRDEDAVDRGICEELAVILVAARSVDEVAPLHLLFRKTLLEAFHARNVDVGKRDEIANRLAAVGEARRHVVPVGDASAADDAERDLVGRRLFAEDARRDEYRGRACGDHAGETCERALAKVAPRNFQCFLHGLSFR